MKKIDNVKLFCYLFHIHFNARKFSLVCPVMNINKDNSTDRQISITMATNNINSV